MAGASMGRRFDPAAGQDRPASGAVDVPGWLRRPGPPGNWTGPCPGSARPAARRGVPMSAAMTVRRAGRARPDPWPGQRRYGRVPAARSAQVGAIAGRMGIPGVAHGVTALLRWPRACARARWRVAWCGPDGSVTRRVGWHGPTVAAGERGRGWTPMAGAAACRACRAGRSITPRRMRRARERPCPCPRAPGGHRGRAGR